MVSKQALSYQQACDHGTRCRRTIPHLVLLHSLVWKKAELMGEIAIARIATIILCLR